MQASRLLLATAATLLLGAATLALAAPPIPRTTAVAKRRAAPAKATALRIDPSYWFVGMKNPKVQLLVHAPGIAGSTAALGAYPGVTLDGFEKLESPNYLIVNLSIGPEAKPGQLKLTLKGIKNLAATYELRPRNQDP